MNNQDFLDALAMVSFLVGIANYNENLTQSDKDDIMRRLDSQTNDILMKVQKELETQNEMLREIIERQKSLYVRVFNTENTQVRILGQLKEMQKEQDGQRKENDN